MAGDINLLRETCGKCSNRVFIQNSYYNNCNGAGCHCAKTCPNGQFMLSTGQCHSCDMGGFTMTGGAPNENWTAMVNHCLSCGMLPETPNGMYPKCRECTYSQTTITATNANCISQCKGVRYVSGNNQCTLIHCSNHIY